MATTVLMASLFLMPSAFAQDLDCTTDFQFQEDAQAVFDQDTSDPNGLDGPKGPTSSGVPSKACEMLPSRGTAAEQPPQQAKQPSSQQIEQQPQQEEPTTQAEEEQTSAHPSVEHDDAVY
jgi:hypothetical protein